MSLTKVNYIDNSTIITAKNLNDIQDNIVQNAELIKKVTPRNLLDNSDFRNPVNQRGQTVYSFDSGYAIDRWRLHWTGDGSMAIYDGYISLYRPVHSAYLFQNLPLELGLIGKTVTVAAKVRGSGAVGFCFNDGAIRELAYISGSDWTILTKTIQVPAYSYDNHILNGVELQCHSSINMDIEWAALYEGEYTADTLPEYQPKGYENELLVCRQYDSTTGKYIGLRKFGQPHNLLDNSDFRNPVNQRGVTATSGRGVYTFDRWFIDSSNGNGYWDIKPGVGFAMNVNGDSWMTFSQRVSGLDQNKQYTIAFMDGAGIIHVNESSDILWSNDHGDVRLILGSGTRIIVWAALYEGEYTADTLPEYQPKGYENELLVCRQYDSTTGEYIGLRKFSQPRNLLDNSNFKNPVNQRGQTTCDTNGYWIDRWIHNNVAYMDIKTGCIGINAHGNTIGGLTQFLENPALYDGKKLTLAVLAKSNGGKMRLSVPYVGEITNIQLSGEWNVYTFTVTFHTNVCNCVGVFAESGSAIDVAWVALYEGEYTNDTLPEYQPKGYGAELTECMRYFIKTQRAYQTTISSNGITPGAQFPVPMRTNPTVTVFDAEGNANRVSAWQSSGISSIVVHQTPSTNTGIYYVDTAAPANAICCYSYEANAELQGGI